MRLITRMVARRDDCTRQHVEAIGHNNSWAACPVGTSIAGQRLSDRTSADGYSEHKDTPSIMAVSGGDPIVSRNSSFCASTSLDH